MKSSAAPSCVALVALLLAVSACNKQPEPIPNEKPADPPASAAPMANPHAMPSGAAMGAPPSGATVEDIGYTAPKSWTSAPNPSPMRKATFKIPKSGGDADDAELAVSAASGGVEPNVKRWEGQFGDAKAKMDPRTVNGLKVVVVEIKGKYASGGMMGTPSAPKDNMMLLGAIVDSGDRQFFFKMIGGEKTLTAARPDFDAFVSSFHPQ